MTESLIAKINKEVEPHSYEDLLSRLNGYLVAEDIARIEEAYELALAAHGTQVRKSGQPYIVHPINVAYILAQQNASPEGIIAGLLHDVVEDTEVSSEMVAAQFGDDVAKLVDGVTKLDQLANSKKLSRSEASNENYQKLILAMVKDVRVVLVKLADRLHNMRTIQYLSVDKQVQIAQETMDILAPLAHRLGMFKIKSELEDLAFAVLQPEDYEKTITIIEEIKKDRQGSIDAMIEKISCDLRDHHIPHTIKGRVKSIFSMWKKIDKNDGLHTEIYDLLAIRILTDTIKDCYSTLGYIHHLFIPMPKRIKDYIAVPKTNGYQSLHTTVLGDQGTIFEIQIRTYEMDHIAENGVAAHWAYKEGKSVRDAKQLTQMQKELKLFQDLEEAINLNEHAEADAAEFIKTVKHDVFEATVYAFTPQGDVYQLSKGATPIDFAYRVHTQVGNELIGVKVNNRMVPISYKIKTGDIVEILTSPTGKPSQSWLRIVSTTRARNKIRAYFKKERREQNVLHGKERIMRTLKEGKLDYDSLFNDEGIAFILARFAFQNFEELLAAVGQNVMSEKTIINRLIEFHDVSDKKIEFEDVHKVETMSGNKKERLDKKDNNIVEIAGVSNVRVSLAKCCAPIPDDSLLGYVSKGQGISVHRAECPHIKDLQERRIDVIWAADLPETKYIVPVNVMSFDRQGILSELLQALYKANTDIVDIQSKVEADNIVYTKIMLTTTDTDHLHKIFLAIKRVPDVYEVSRVFL
jgi:GTP pyrophosphokinase